MKPKISHLGILLFSASLLLVNSALARDLLDKEKTIIAKTVKGQLLDPESARFKWVPVQTVGISAYCGIVNSKNRFGGYAGDSPYIVFLVWDYDKTVGMAAPLKIGSNDPNAPETVATLQTCEKRGYTKLFMAE